MSGNPGTATITVATNDGGYRATCVVHVRTTSTAAEAPAAKLPQAHYADGILRLAGLEGYRCTLFSIGGQRIGTFRPGSSDTQQARSLAPGVYILTAQKQGSLISIKIMVGE